ncbi:membrane hypothetical protein [Exiguobacterium sp. 8H]|uniref:acyltransferase family protein n=1 Tax=Exiguobacterium sp. 8H TaxID=2653140 RepID=UPI0012F3FEB1|nr:membrane hypothetical protein [Exiguobacterium sp. 8H]
MFSLIFYPFLTYYTEFPDFIVLIFTVMMFILYAKTTSHIGNNKIILNLNRYSLYVYIFHLSFLKLSNKLLQINLGNTYWQNWWYPLIILTGLIGPIVLYHTVNLLKTKIHTMVT